MKESQSGAGVRRVRVSAERDGQRLDNFLVGQLKGVPRSAIHRLIRTGQVRVNGGRAKSATRVNAGDEVRVPPATVRSGSTAVVPQGAIRRLDESVLYDDGDILVLDKSAGMAVHAGSGLAWGIIEALRQSRPDQQIELVHRLDRDTSGCLMLARQRSTLLALQEQWRGQEVDKRYLCLLDGRLAEDVVEVDAPLQKVERSGERMVVTDPQGQSARTTFRLLQRYQQGSYVEAELHTGRTHQIRAHAAHLGMPLAGDERYSDNRRHKNWKKQGLKRMFLHAHRLGFSDANGVAIQAEAPLPEPLRDFLNVLDHLSETG